MTAHSGRCEPVTEGADDADASTEPGADTSPAAIADASAETGADPTAGAGADPSTGTGSGADAATSPETSTETTTNAADDRSHTDDVPASHPGDQPGDRSADHPAEPAADDPDELPGRLTVAELRADGVPTLRLALAVVLVGLPLGAVWAWLAPGVGTVTLAGGVTGTLPVETDHAFDAVAVFVLLTVAFGVIAGAVAWRRRAHRGPVMLVGVVVATLVGAWVAGRFGAWLAPTPTPVSVLVDRAAVSDSSSFGLPLPGTYGAPAASPGPWWAALLAGLAAAMTYVLAAIADGHEDPRHPEPE